MEEKQTIYVDVKDLIEYVSVNTTYSGIQRVASEFLYFMAEHSNVTVTPVVPIGDNFMSFRMRYLNEIYKLINNGQATRERLDKIIHLLKNKSRPVEPKRGSIYFMIGAFWIYDNYDYIARLKSKDVRFTLFVHDLIQIANPEYVDDGANRKFLKSFTSVLFLVDRIITNSNYVASDCKKFISEKLGNNIKTIPDIRTVQLATELRLVSKDDDNNDYIPEFIRQKGYVLCVGTLEIRKNNMYLVTVFEKMRASLGSDRVPYLVFCGKRGWKNESFFNYIEERGHLGNWIFIFESVPDKMLSEFYKYCLFTAYPSFAEGWGLPISESLAYGKTCVCSNTTSMPEVGRDFVYYIDPFSIESGVKTFTNLLCNEHEIKTVEEHIRKDYKIKPWSEFSRMLCINLTESVDNITTPNSLFYPGQIYLFSEKQIEDDFRNGKSLKIAKMSATEGWHASEDFGRWASNRSATIEFFVNDRIDEGIQAYIELRLPNEISDRNVIVVCDGLSNQELHVFNDPSWYPIRLTVGQNGLIRFRLVSSGASWYIDDRGHIYVGISRIIYCNKNDIDCRLGFLETIASNRKSPIIENIVTNVTNVANDNQNLLRSYPPLEFVHSFVTRNIDNDGIIKNAVKEFYLSRARTLARKKQWEKAANYYFRIAYIGMLNSKLLVQLGHCLNESGMTQSAIYSYALAVNADEKNDDAKFHLKLNLDRSSNQNTNVF